MSNKSKIISVLLVGFIASIILRVFVLDSFIVSGDSMEPSILSGDYVFVYKLSYSWSEPRRGDVIVATPRNINEKIVKRIIGLPSEWISIENGQVVVRRGRRGEGQILSEMYKNGEKTPEVGITNINLDPQEYFVLGDNREVSVDSRELGLIDSWDIDGRVIGAFRIKDFSFHSF